MPSYGETLAESKIVGTWSTTSHRWAMATIRNYSTLLVVKRVDEELDVSDPDTLFANAPMSRFPLVGQIVEPGRNFFQSINNVDVRAVYNRRKSPSSSSGTTSPGRHGFERPDDASAAVGRGQHRIGLGGADEEDEGGFWGAEEEEEASEEDIWGADVVDEDEGDDDFWGEGDDDGGETAGEGFSDAIGLQFPSKLPSGNRKPYFIFGDKQSSVDLLVRRPGEERRAGDQQYLGAAATRWRSRNRTRSRSHTSYDRGSLVGDLQAPL